MVAALGIVAGVGNGARAQFTQSWIDESTTWPAVGRDSANAAAHYVDANGDEFVYVTGFGSTLTGGRLFATHKYHALPQAPLAQFDEPVVYYPASLFTPTTHEAVALTVDSNDGSVYVVGTSDVVGEGTNIVLIKYDDELGEVWRKSWGTSGNDRAVSVVIDDSAVAEEDRRVYVTGTTGGFGLYDDIITLNFVADTGLFAPEWADLGTAGNGVGQRRYNNELYNGPESASDMAYQGVEPGETFFTGLYIVGTGYNGATNDDILVISYDRFGDMYEPDWPQYFDLAGFDDVGVAIARDDEATGQFGGSVLIAGTVMPAPSGPPSTAMPLSGGPMGAAAAAAEPDTDYVTIGYSTGGGPNFWYQTHDGPDIDSVDVAVDIVTYAGLVVTTGTVRSGGRKDIATVRYTTSGAPGIVEQYGNIQFDEYVTEMVKSPWGVYLTGWVDYRDLDFAPISYLTMKYDFGSAGPVWAVAYPGMGLSPSTAHAIAAGGLADVFVSGGSQRPGRGEDTVTIRYKEP